MHPWGSSRRSLIKSAGVTNDYTMFKSSFKIKLAAMWTDRHSAKPVERGALMRAAAGLSGGGSLRTHWLTTHALEAGPRGTGPRPPLILCDSRRGRHRVTRQPLRLGGRRRRPAVATRIKKSPASDSRAPHSIWRAAGGWPAGRPHQHARPIYKPPNGHSDVGSGRLTRP